MTIVGLQYLRALAALAVVVFHAAHGARFAHAGHRGVDVFFVISGFIVTYTTYGQVSGPDDRAAARAFIVRRLTRIAPLYWLATLVSVLFRLRYGAPGRALWLDFAFIAHPHAQHVGHCYPFLVPGWSLNFEVFFYVVFAVCMLFGRAHALWAALLMTATSALGSAFPFSGVARFYLAPFGAEFSLGIALALLHRTRVKPPRAIAALISLAGAAWLFHPHPNQQSADALAAATLVYGCLYAFEGVRLPRLMLLGDASYAIYLVHTEVVSLARGFLLIPLGLDDAQSPRGLVGMAVCIALTIWFGVVVHRKVERPIGVAIKRWLATSPALSRGAET